MKKILMIAGLALTLVYCNTPQPRTSPNSDTTTITTDTTARGTDTTMRDSTQLLPHS